MRELIWRYAYISWWRNADGLWRRKDNLRMRVRDYDIIKDIDVLFQKRIIIYGAGHDGKELFLFLKPTGVEVDCFCDKDKEKKECLGCRVIPLETLKEKAKSEDCLIIVASRNFREEIIRTLELEKIEAYVCTDTAIKWAIDFHVEGSDRFDAEWSKFYRQKKINHICSKAIRLVFWKLDEFYSLDYSIFVYQPGKVGSTTLVRTITKYGIGCLHIHWLLDFKMRWNIDETFLKTLEEQGNFIKHHFSQLYTNGCKIITLVRDPIARAISEYVQMSNEKRFIDKKEDDFEQELKNVIFLNLKNNDEFEWFDKEIKALTGIDIYEYPFDKEKGYTIIKKDTIELLVLKLEKLDENEDILGEFVGEPNLKIQRANIGSEKDSKYIYEGIKEQIRFPRELIEYQYMHNEKMNHFYSEEERRTLMRKWEKKLLDNQTF